MSSRVYAAVCMNGSDGDTDADKSAIHTSKDACIPHGVCL